MPPRSGATGTESAQHLWLKARLTGVCQGLGWSAVPEDPVTRADVWVPDARLALEVQLRRSDVLARTAAKLGAGAADVLWLFPPEVPARRMLFSVPAVRVAVLSADGTDPVQPWRLPAAPARLMVYGTVWRWRDWRLAMGAMSVHAFLRDLLAGDLGWCPPGTPGLPGGRGGWIRWRDLARALALPPDVGQRLPPLLPRSPAQWIEAQLERRARHPPGRGEAAMPDRPKHEPRQGLLDPQRDPESQDEREPGDDAERSRWEAERPPHYEAR